MDVCTYRRRFRCVRTSTFVNMPHRSGARNRRFRTLTRVCFRVSAALADVDEQPLRVRRGSSRPWREDRDMGQPQPFTPGSVRKRLCRCQRQQSVERPLPWRKCAAIRRILSAFACQRRNGQGRGHRERKAGLSLMRAGTAMRARTADRCFIVVSYKFHETVGTAMRFGAVTVRHLEERAHDQM